MLVSEGSDSSPIPTAQAYGWLYTPTLVRIVVIGSPNATLEPRIDLQCSKGNHNRRVLRDVTPRPGPILQRIRLPFRRPDDCHLDVTAGYADVEQAGTITAKLYGHGRLSPF